MKDKRRKRWTRRDFLRSAATATVMGAAGVSVFCREGTQTGPAKSAADAVATTRPAPGRARVVLVRDPDVLDEGGNPRAEVVARMLDDAVEALTGESSAEAAWAGMLDPADTVGIKSNQWRFLNTTPEVEGALRKRVLGAGVTEDRVAIDDRGVLRNPVFERSTALVNARPLRTHHWSGVGSCMKNYIMFSPDPPSWHEDACANLAGLWNLPAVRDKTRLNVLVMFTPLFHGKGPHHFDPRYTWKYGA